ncbi:MAG: ribosome biogenesis GTPase Der [Steroidobacteraceae bacterium]
MLPVIALVGRPNVGKSTLFNRLTASRAAIVADEPGVTRDRQYGRCRIGDLPCIVIDTGGLTEAAGTVETQMQRQAERAITEADRIIFIVDARDGLTTADESIAASLRRAGKPVTVAVNKCEGRDEAIVTAEFHALGLGEPVAIAAAHGSGVDELLQAALAGCESASAPEEEADGIIRVAIVGRPNVGKSTLVNRLVGDERVIAADEPGTTRDSIHVPFERDGQRFELIDTAGMRRRGRIDEGVEQFSVARALQAMASAHVVIVMIDAHEVVAEQDASILGMALDEGRALLIAVNKWDGIAAEQRDEIRNQLQLRLDFVPYAPVHFISARHGTGVGELAESVVRAYQSAMRAMPTPELTRVLEAAIAAHQPPLVRGRRIKLRYAHQGGRNPPRIVVHGGQTRAVPAAYQRYLANRFREHFDLYATPVFMDFRSDENPYAARGGRRSGKP